VDYRLRQFELVLLLGINVEGAELLDLGGLKNLSLMLGLNALALLSWIILFYWVLFLFLLELFYSLHYFLNKSYFIFLLLGEIAEYLFTILEAFPLVFDVPLHGISVVPDLTNNLCHKSLVKFHLLIHFILIKANVH
jgi:hypothetical protein